MVCDDVSVTCETGTIAVVVSIYVVLVTAVGFVLSCSDVTILSVLS